MTATLTHATPLAQIVADPLDPADQADRPLLLLMVGILAPLGCLLADPIVFTTESIDGGHGVAAALRAPAWMTFGVAMLTLLGWWFCQGSRDPGLRGFFSAVLRTGSGIAYSVGVAMLPLTLVGLFVGIGVLGFTPFVVGWVYGREARRAAAGVPRCYTRVVGAGVGVGLLVTTALCGFALKAQAERDIDAVIANPIVADEDGTVDRLAVIHWAGDTRRMASAWGGAWSDWVDDFNPGSADSQRLADIYWRLTGRNIESDYLRAID